MVENSASLRTTSHSTCDYISKNFAQKFS